VVGRAVEVGAAVVVARGVVVGAAVVVARGVEVGDAVVVARVVAGQQMQGVIPKAPLPWGNRKK